MTGNLLRDRPPPQSADEQIEKLSTDLVEAYEALTLVYRTVSNLGGLFRLEDITAYLVNQALEAAEADSAALYLQHGDNSYPLAIARDGLELRLAADAPARLLQLGRPLFFHGELAAEYTRLGARPIRHVLAAPLETGGRTLGILVLERDGEERFTTGDVKLVFALCGLTAVAVANFQHYRAVNYEREMLEGVIREIGDGIVVTDHEFRSRLTNEAARRFLGITDAEPEGFDVLGRLGAYQLSVTAEELRNDDSVIREFTAESFDQRRPVVLRCAAFRARLGTEAEPIQVLCLRDITVEHRAAQSQREFMSLAAHKLRTPLTKIMGLLPLARDPDADGAIKTEAFQGIDRGAEELRDLVNGVLQFVEFRQGSRVLQSVDLEQLLVVVFESVRERRRDRRIEEIVEIRPGLPTVYGSRQMLFTLLEQLIDNAIKFTPSSQPMVKVLLEPLGADRVRIQVEDRGEGIPRDLLRRMFRPFFQRDEEFTGQAEGTGLGLMLVRQVVDRHGGRLSAESDPGSGSRFTVELSVRSEEATT